MLTRAYKLLSIIAKAYQLPKAAVAAGRSLSKEFEDLVSMVHKDLTHRVYHFLTDEQEVSFMFLSWGAANHEPQVLGCFPCGCHYKFFF